MSTINIVGLDPSMSNWGIARAILDLDTLTFHINDLRLVSTAPEKDKHTRKVVRKNSEDLQRAKILHKGLQQATEGAFIAFVEVPVGSQSARAMASYGMCLGVLASCTVPIVEVTPSEVKLAGAGVKTATKDEMIEWATNKYPGAPWLTHKVAGQLKFNNSNEHLADAVGAIEAGLQTDEFKKIVSIIRGNPVLNQLVLNK